jgi:hypothetical protein
MIVLSERAVKLGGSGREIARLCDGSRTSREIVGILAARHPEQPHLADDVHDFIGEMVRLEAFRWAPR